MSHDPQSPSDAADHDDKLWEAPCGDCQDDLDSNSISTEGFEEFGVPLCHECYANRCEEDGE